MLETLGLFGLLEVELLPTSTVGAWWGVGVALSCIVVGVRLSIIIIGLQSFKLYLQLL